MARTERFQSDDAEPLSPECPCPERRRCRRVSEALGRTLCDLDPLSPNLLTVWMDRDRQPGTKKNRRFRPEKPAITRNAAP